MEVFRDYRCKSIGDWIMFQDLEAFLLERKPEYVDDGVTYHDFDVLKMMHTVGEESILIYNVVLDKYIELVRDEDEIVAREMIPDEISMGCFGSFSDGKILKGIVGDIFEIRPAVKSAAKK
jgi:hypothetical protein